MTFSEIYFKQVKDLGIDFDRSNFPVEGSDKYKSICRDIDALPEQLKTVLQGDAHLKFLEEVARRKGCIYVKDNTDYGVFYAGGYGELAIGSLGGFYIATGKANRPLQLIFRKPQRDCKRVSCDDYTLKFLSQWLGERETKSLSETVKSILKEGNFTSIEEQFWQQLDNLETQYHSIIIDIFYRLSFRQDKTKKFQSNKNEPHQMLFNFSGSHLGGLKFYGPKNSKYLTLEIVPNQLSSEQRNKLHEFEKKFSEFGFFGAVQNWRKFTFSPSVIDELKQLVIWWLPLPDGETSPTLKPESNNENQMTKNKSQPLNQILYGPPGTGKTYHTIEAAVKAAEPNFVWNNRAELKQEYERLVAKSRIRFVTFHQSYGYEDFVEGLKAKTTDERSIEYVVENGVFKAIVEDAKSSDLRKAFEVNSDATIWKISIDGTGQSEVSNYCLSNGLAAIGWGEAGNLLSEDLDSNEYYQNLGPQVKSSLYEFSQRASVGDLILCIGSQRTVQAVGVIDGDYRFEQAGTSLYSHYCNQLPVNWLVTDIDIDFHELNGGVNFTQKTFYELWRFSVSDVFDLLKKRGVDLNSVKAEQEIENYVLIIDEINRGNISKIFGELITLVEPSKRKGSDEFIELTLPQSKKPFSVPDNLYIIGTMNTADRSLAMMDTALRRRFDFIEMMPKPKLLANTVVNNIDLEKLLIVLNERIEILYDREHTLGHAFFMPVKALADEGKHDKAFNVLVSVFKNKIIPLLEEYFFEDWSKIRLVLADNQKFNKDLQFIKKTEQTPATLNSLFGNRHNLGQYGQSVINYTLAADSDAVWKNAKAYIGIYQPMDETATVLPKLQTEADGELL
ncbi:AAA family ATPase [Photobacterium angustum]|uniref:AAA family ATPase n=1 Tax=Photobacterium angustum TaxID=661 RepID=UPI00069CA1E5|nr:AAA family ATPase [Photobacterium angustum]